MGRLEAPRLMRYFGCPTMNGTIWGCVGSTTAHMLMLDVDVVDIVVLGVKSFITKIADPQ